MKTIAFYLPVFLNYSETFVYSLAINISKFKVIIICRQRKNCDSFPYANVFQVEKRAQIKQVLRAQQVDLIHAQYGTFGADIMGIAQSLKIPLITHFRGQDAYQLPRDFFIRISYLRLFKKAALVLAVSAHMKKELQGLGCTSDKIEVYYGGIELPEYRPRNLPAGNIKLLMAGRLTEKKGMETGILAVKELISKGYRLTLTIVGDGELKQYLQTIIQKYSLQDRIEMTGRMSSEQLQKELYRADILLAPHQRAVNGDSEGIPNVIKEAMAAGLPVVTTRHSGIPELVLDGQTGFVAAEYDRDGFIDKLEQALNYSGLDSLCRQARLKVEKDFDVKKQVIRLEDIYQQVLNRAYS